MWEEIHGFVTIGEYNRFIDHIEEQLRSQSIKEISPNVNYNKGEIYGGRWFMNLKNDEIWRLIPPDIPFKGLWEKVE